MPPQDGEVALWQTLLSRVEVTVAVTGEWDDETARATAEWQATVGLDPTGTLDRSTWNKAKRALRFLDSQRPGKRPRLGPGDTGQHVRYAQRRLCAEGLTVTIDGRFSPAMRQAVRRFRDRHGLPAGDGIDRAVWEALG